MKKLLYTLIFVSSTTFGQVFAPDSTFQFKPIYKDFQGKVYDLNFSNDGTFFLRGIFNKFNGKIVENNFTSNNSSYFRIDKLGNIIEGWRYFNDIYSTFYTELKNGNSLWKRFEFTKSGYMYSIAKVNKNGVIDNSFHYEFADENYGFPIVEYLNNTFIAPTNSKYGEFSVLDSNGKVVRTLNIEILKDKQIRNIKVVQNGKILVQYNENNVGGFLIQLNADFSIDKSFKTYAESFYFSNLTITANNDIYVVIPISSNQGKIKKINKFGILDASFEAQSPIFSSSFSMANLTVLNTGKLVFYSYEGHIFRFNADGTLDSNFKYAPQQNSNIWGVDADGNVLQTTSDGKIIKTDSLNIPVKNFKIELLNNKALFINSVNKFPNGKFLIGAGESLYSNQEAKDYLHDNNNSQLWRRYDKNWNVELEYFSDAILPLRQLSDDKFCISKDNKLIFVSSDSVRIVQDTLANYDVRFCKEDGKIYMANKFGLFRYDEFGNKDLTFGNKSIYHFFYIKRLQNGKFLIFYQYTSPNVYGQYQLSRLNNDGSFDISFKPIEGFYFYGSATGFFISYEVFELKNSQFLISSNYNGWYSFKRFLNRYNEDGTVDPLFKAVSSSGFSPIQKVGNQYLLTQNSLIRISELGQVDSSFVIKGFNGAVFSFEQIDDSNILVGNGVNIIRLSLKNQKYILFEPIETVFTIGDKPIVLKAKTNTNSPVKFKSLTNTASVKDSILTFESWGDGTVRAEADGFLPISYSFTVKGKIQRIKVQKIENKYANDSPFTINASVDTGLPLNYYLLSGSVGKISNNVITLTGDAGNLQIRVNQSGTNIYYSADTLVFVTVLKSPILSNDFLETPISIYPNPTSNRIYINSQHLGNKTIQLFNLRGELVFSKEQNLLETNEIEVNGLPKGIYFVKISTFENSITKKIVIE